MKKIKILSEGSGEKGLTSAKEILGGISATVVSRNTAVGVLFSLAGFLLGRTPLLFDTFPMGLALLCASEKNLLWIMVGLLASVFAVEGENTVFSAPLYIGVYVFAYLLRFVALIAVEHPEGVTLKDLFSAERKRAFQVIIKNRYRESLSLRMSCASVAALIAGVYMLRVGEYRYYDLFGALFMILASPTFAFLYSGMFAEDEQGTLPAFLRCVSGGTLLFSCIYSLKGAVLLGVSLPVFSSFLSVMYISKKDRNFLVKQLMAFSAGMAVSPSLTPAFMLSAAVLTLTRNRTGVSNLVLSGAAGLLWGGFAGGVSGVLQLLPGFMTAALAETAFEAVRSFSFEKKDGVSEEQTDAASAQRLVRLSETFSSLSEKLFELSSVQKRPSPVEVRGICLESARSVCVGCPKTDECHGEKNYGLLSERIETLCGLLMKKGRAEKTDIPDHLTEGCHRWEQLLHNVNFAYASLLREAVMRDKIELFALDYEAISRIISDAAEAENKANERDSRLESQIMKLSQKKGLGFCGVRVYGSTNPRIEIRRIGRTAQEMKTCELRCLMEEACGFPVTQPTFNIKGPDISMCFEAAQRFSAEIGLSSEGVENNVCGDTVDSFSCGKNLYAVISDGMGSGEPAKRASGICCDFLRCMLEGGNRKETAVRMLGTVLRSKGDEYSATLDLAELDTVTGELSFLKSGAASSFVRRGEKLFSLAAKTMPVGILRGYDGELTKFVVCDGDVAILLSDGISPSPEFCPWLTELLGSGDEFYLDPARAACAITSEARKRGSRDDVSAAVIKITKTA